MARLEKKYSYQGVGLAVEFHHILYGSILKTCPDTNPSPPLRPPFSVRDAREIVSPCIIEVII